MRRPEIAEAERRAGLRAREAAQRARALAEQYRRASAQTSPRED